MNLVFIILYLVLLIYLILKAVKQYKESKNIDEKVLSWIVYISIFFPIVIFILDYYNISNKFHWENKLNSSEWLNILFVYVSSLISALIGAFVTIKSVKMSIENQEKSRKEDNKNQALPLLKISAEAKKLCNNKYIIIASSLPKETKKRNDILSKVTIKIENVGMRELYDLYIGNINSNIFNESEEYYKINSIVYKNDYTCFDLYFYIDNNKNKKDTSNNGYITFNSYFKDCYNNWYYQILRINIEYPKTNILNIIIDNCEIVSPPIEIEENKLS